MPRDTFFNLPEEKKIRIIEAAIDEFAAYSYHKSSINRIVDKADIAKGSFYQYFAGKKDLFKYLLIEVAAEKKINYLDNVVNKKEGLDFFQLLRKIYLAGIRFGQENPKLQLIGIRFIKSSSSKFKEEIFEDSSNLSNTFFKGLINRGVSRGEINPDVNVELAALILTQFSFTASEYFLNKKKIDCEKKQISYEEEEIMEVIDDVIYIVKNGIGNIN